MNKAVLLSMLKLALCTLMATLSYGSLQTRNNLGTKFIVPTLHPTANNAFTGDKSKLALQFLIVAITYGSYPKKAAPKIELKCLKCNPLWYVICLGNCSTSNPSPKNISKYLTITNKDSYLCHSIALNQSQPTYIVGFVPDANKEIAHHILIYGCGTPGSQENVWNCGDMSRTSNEYATGGVCGSGSQIIYAWAMDAPSLILPKDVGFMVGGKTDIKYLVLQVHYKNVEKFLPPQNEKDSSGVELLTSRTPMPKLAGVYLLGTGGRIPPKSVEYMETACKMEENVVMYPFGFRTHAHIHGEVNAGYRIRDGKWTEIGRRSPHDPQMFYNVTSPGIEIRKDDILAARCTMKNDENRTIYTGFSQNDEMCNFYIMYYVDGDKTPNQRSCFSSGPPSFYWEKSSFAKQMNLKEVPKTASVVPFSRVLFEMLSPARNSRN